MSNVAHVGSDTEDNEDCTVQLAKPSAARAVPDNNPSSSNYCDICSVRFKSENDLTEHLAQKRHQTRVKEAGSISLSLSFAEHSLFCV